MAMLGRESFFWDRARQPGFELYNGVHKRGRNKPRGSFSTETPAGDILQDSRENVKLDAGKN